jgi:peptidoglycan/xylan/chitin deacetylase (PgdA/CDA1 family)
MAKHLSLVTFLLFTTGVTSCFSQSKLVFTSTYEGIYHRFDSLMIEDLNTGSKIMKYYPDTLLKLLITGTDDLPGTAQFSLSQNYPNPYENTTQFNICLPENDNVSINIFNISGKTVLKWERSLLPGNHSFTFNGSREKLYLLSVKTSTYSSAIKMINASNNCNSGVNLQYNGNKTIELNSKKGKSEFNYNTGDNLVFTGYMTDVTGLVVSDTITDTPAVSTTYTLRFEKIPRIVILMYHKITDSVPVDEYERNIADFENDLIYLQENNYRILSMEDLPQLQSGSLKLNSDGIIITFDDGYESNYTIVYPLLVKYRMAATFFLTTEWMETSDYMTWSEVWLMSQYLDPEGKSVFKMASHTSSHPFLEKSAQNFATHEEYLNFLYAELNDSRTWIVDITQQASIFLSLPYGDGANNQDIINTARTTGYSGIRTSVWNSFTVEKMNLYSLPSIPILSGTSINLIENYLKY